MTTGEGLIQNPHRSIRGYHWCGLTSSVVISERFFFRDSGSDLNVLCTEQQIEIPSHQMRQGLIKGGDKVGTRLIRSVGFTWPLQNPTGLCAYPIQCYWYMRKAVRQNAVASFPHHRSAESCSILCSALSVPPARALSPQRGQGHTALCAVLAEQHQSPSHWGHQPQRAEAGLCMFVLHAVLTCQACRVSLGTPPTLQHPEQSAALSPKCPRHMSVTSPLCSAHYRFYSFQWGRCAAWLRPINMLQDHYPIKFPLI